MDRKPESSKTRLERWGFNWFPAFRGTGGKITHISADYRVVAAKLPLRRKTRNYVGTIFGGSMFSVVDPVYMVMLYKILGNQYSIWVKSAEIEFLKPGKSTLYAVFQLPESETKKIEQAVSIRGKTQCDLTIELTDKNGTVHAVVRQCLHVSQKSRGK